jgi:hypothetical protein
MDFFKSLTLDLQMLVVAIAGCALLALFSGNQKAEKRYLLAFAVLAAIGVYRFNQTGAGTQEPRSAATRTTPHAATPAPKHTPLVSTSAKQ